MCDDVWLFFSWRTAPCRTEGRGPTAAVLCPVLLLLLLFGGGLAFLLWRYSNASLLFSGYALIIKPYAGIKTTLQYENSGMLDGQHSDAQEA